MKKQKVFCQENKSDMKYTIKPDGNDVAGVQKYIEDNLLKDNFLIKIF